MEIVIYDRVGIGRVVFTRRGDKQMAQFAVGFSCSVVFVCCTRIVGVLIFFGALRLTEADAAVVVVVRQYREQQKREPCEYNEGICNPFFHNRGRLSSVKNTEFFIKIVSQKNFI